MRFVTTLVLVLSALCARASAQTFQGCGKLVQGVSCVLFQADAGGLYKLDTNGGFPLGASVLVTGTLNPGCITICQQGNGCISQNTIQPCSPGTAFCVPVVSAIACPCNNNGAGGAGCANSQPASQGASLSATGTTAPDTVVLQAQAMLSTSLCIFLQGDGVLAGGVLFGDGVRCAGGQLLRLAVKNASGGAATYPDAGVGDPSITQRCAQLGAPIGPNSDRHYQTYYRDPSPVFCPAPQGSTFNITSGLSIHWP